MTHQIINGPIYEGCYVRLRNGIEVGPITKNPIDAGDFVWCLRDIISWAHDGRYVAGDAPQNIEAVIPSSFTATPPADQALWDRAALEISTRVSVPSIDDGDLKKLAEIGAIFADAFMAERAKRIKT